MDKYEVIETIVEGFNFNHPNRYSSKIVARKGTFLIAVKNHSRIGEIIELKKQSGKYVCDLGSHTANKHCIKC